MFNIVKVSKSIQPNKCIHNFFNENPYLSVSYIFLNWMGPIKWTYDVPNYGLRMGLPNLNKPIFHKTFDPNMAIPSFNHFCKKKKFQD
jgi:hypothetical protein